MSVRMKVLYVCPDCGREERFDQIASTDGALVPPRRVVRCPECQADTEAATEDLSAFLRGLLIDSAPGRPDPTDSDWRAA